MDVLNLAHGALYLVGAYLAVRFAGDGQATAWAFLAAGLAAVVVGAAAGAGLAVLARPLGRRGHLDQALLTLGVALVVGDLLSARFGNDVQSVPPPAFLAGGVSIAGREYPSYRLAVIVAGLALAVLVYALVERSRAGALVRATVADAPMVRALGVDTGRLVVAVFAFGVVLACLGGVLGAPVLGAYPGLDERVLILGLVVVVLGGLGSVPGAFLGAMVIGQVEVLGVSLLPQYASFLVFGAMARVAAGLVLGLLALVPLLVSSNVADMLTRVLAFALLAIGLDLLAGVGGLPSLGQAAPFGVGAYTAALLAKHVTTVGPVQLLAAAVAGAGLAAAVGWLLVRSRGTYFLMLTLAVGEIVHELADRWEGVTGGSNGLAGVPAINLYPGAPPVRLAGLLYWYVLAAVLVCAGALWVVSRSAFGRTLRGVRDNEERMRSLGYWTFLPKYAVFCIAGAAAGAAGSLWVAQARFVSPADLGFEVSALALLAVVIGGRGSLWGAALGAAVVVLVREELSPQLGGRGPLVLGLVFVAAVYLLPRGFAGTRLSRRGSGPRRTAAP